MNTSRGLGYVIVAASAFFSGMWLQNDGMFNLRQARAEETPKASKADRPKVHSLTFVDEIGREKAELVVRETTIDGRPTMQLALVDPVGREIWAGPSSARVVNAR